MRAKPTNLETDLECLVAELTEAAYRVALRHGIKGTFVDLELGLWDAIRAYRGRLEHFASASPSAGPSSGPRPLVPAPFSSPHLPVPTPSRTQ
jgi:hypothetical protein